MIEACALGGMHVPNDVAVVGVDEDHLLSELSNPPLSSVALNAEQGGYEAAELLDGLMSGRVKEPRLILVEPRWVVARPSSDVIAVDDRDVAAAVAYIRDNARRHIGVEDIVKHSAVSRPHWKSASTAASDDPSARRSSGSASAGSSNCWSRRSFRCGRSPKTRGLPARGT